MVSYADVGGLGAREGTPVGCTWEPPPPPPPRIVAVASAGAKILGTMLVLLPLFLFRANRCAKAWWIWVPVVLAGLAGTVLAAGLIDEEVSLVQAICGCVVGQAAVWLLMPYLGARHRLVAFCKTLPIGLGFGLVAFAPTLLGPREGFLDLRLAWAGLLACATLAATMALSLAGFSVRRRFGRVRFVFWLAVWSLAAWTAIAVPFLIVGLLGGNAEWEQPLLAVLCLSGITVGLLLPLVLLSLFQPFYRARFFAYFKTPQPGATEGIAPPLNLPRVEPTQAATTRVGAGP